MKFRDLVKENILKLPRAFNGPIKQLYAKFEQKEST